MSWLQIHLITDKERAPLIELLFENIGALSVTLGDAADEALLEPAPGESPLWRQTRVSALFRGDSDADALRSAIAQTLGQDTGAELSMEVLEDQAWERAWLDAFRPMRFGRRLWVCPDGQQPPVDDAVIVALDPGLAFGTGTHPTTALCLQWLEGRELREREVIDFGCGSGILAVAALKLGAARAIAIDHDPQALEATQANAEKNGVAGRIGIHTGGYRPARPAPLLVANILAGTLIELEPVLAGLVEPGGHIALSGILAEQADQVSACYRADFEMEPPRQLDDWILLEGRRLPVP